MLKIYVHSNISGQTSVNEPDEIDITTAFSEMENIYHFQVYKCITVSPNHKT